MVLAIVIALVCSHVAAFGLGGYLHYRFGVSVVRKAEAVITDLKVK